jgi:hypothetical protein
MSRAITAAVAAALALGGPVMAQAPADPFATQAQAMDYLAKALPRATAENPRYTAKADGAVSQWLTDALSFAADAKGAVEVKMRESYSVTKGGQTTPGKHEAAFSLADVEIADFSAPQDLTPEGAPARGLLFTCLKPHCIAALWSGAPSRADKTDIYIQDAATRARILAAFRRLQRK